jgi:hypothetical protein
MKIIKSFRLATSLLATLLLCFMVACGDTTTPKPPNPEAPTIASFSASSTTISQGGSTTLSWTLSGPLATTVTIDNGVTVPPGSSSVSVSPSMTTTYTLTATNAKGSNTKKVTVTVTTNPPSGTVNKIGIIALAGGAGVANTSFDYWGGFGSFQTTTAAPFNPYEPTDLCFVAEVQNTAPPTNPTTPSQDPVYLDAGDALTLKSNGSTYAVFPKKINDKGEVGYVSTAELAAPTGTLMLDIPGASNGFPAFSNVTMPAVADDFSFTPSNGAITADTRFTWTGSGPGAMVLFGSGTAPTGNMVYLFCSLKDDGEYEFPADVKSQLTGLTNGRWGVAYRINSRTETRGDAALIMLVYRAKSLVNPFLQSFRLETFPSTF